MALVPFRQITFTKLPKYAERGSVYLALHQIVSFEGLNGRTIVRDITARTHIIKLSVKQFIKKITTT